jgi:hypothetical protein
MFVKNQNKRQSYFSDVLVNEREMTADGTSISGHRMMNDA